MKNVNSHLFTNDQEVVFVGKNIFFEKYILRYLRFCETVLLTLTAVCISCNNAAWTEAIRETDMEESDGEGESETSSDSHSSTYSNQSDKSNESNHSPCLTDDGEFCL